MTTTPTTDVLVVGVLDRSGSMGSCLLGAIEGWNDYVKDLQADTTGETFLWLTGFDTTFDHWEQGTPISQVPFLKQWDEDTHDYPAFVPRGGTALYDAIAHSITAADKYLKQIGRDASSDNPMKVLHVTLTDGGENSSTEYRGAEGAGRLRKLTKAYEGKGNWTFVFLGANQDAHAAGSFIGYAAASTANYSSNSMAGNKRMSSTLSGVTSSLRSNVAMASAMPFADAGFSQELTDEEESAPSVPSVTPGGILVPGTAVPGTTTVPAPEPQKAAEEPIKKGSLDDLLGADTEE